MEHGCGIRAYKAWTFLKEGLKPRPQKIHEQPQEVTTTFPPQVISSLCFPELRIASSQIPCGTSVRDLLELTARSSSGAPDSLQPPPNAARSNVKYTVVFLYPGALFWVRWRAETQYKCASGASGRLQEILGKCLLSHHAALRYNVFIADKQARKSDGNGRVQGRTRISYECQVEPDTTQNLFSSWKNGSVWILVSKPLTAVCSADVQQLR